MDFSIRSKWAVAERNPPEREATASLISALLVWTDFADASMFDISSTNRLTRISMVLSVSRIADVLFSALFAASALLTPWTESCFAFLFRSTTVSDMLFVA